MPTAPRSMPSRRTAWLPSKDSRHSNPQNMPTPPRSRNGSLQMELGWVPQFIGGEELEELSSILSQNPSSHHRLHSWLPAVSCSLLFLVSFLFFFSFISFFIISILLQLCEYLQSKGEAKYPNDRGIGVKYTAVGNLLFLRVFTVLLQPFDLIDGRSLHPSPHADSLPPYARQYFCEGH